jgi:adenosylhomocysteine nucleosidase
MNERPIVILTALDLEYDAVRERLDGLRPHRHRQGTRFEVGRIPGTDRPVALGLTGKGNHASAVLTERAIHEFDPPAVLFAGVAGGLWPDVELGTVVIATHVYAYHGGTSEDDGFKARPRSWEISHELDQLARHVKRAGSWPHPVKFGPIAAGEVVQDSAVSWHAQWIRQTYNDALAIEMESAGVAKAAHDNRSRPLAVVRGISDRADGTKVATDGWQPRAAASAAAFALALAREIDVPEPEPAARPAANVARDHARVGVQAGQVFGDITLR